MAEVAEVTWVSIQRNIMYYSLEGLHLSCHKMFILKILTLVFFILK